MIPTILPAKKVSETLLGTFEFGTYLAVGETISSASAAATLFSGSDATPSAILSGSAAISGTQVTQLLTAGIVGNIYTVSITANTSLGQHLVAEGLLAISQGVL